MDEKYREYLLSSRWKRIKKVIRIRDGGKCQECGETKGFLDVHHITYENLFNESKHTNDLVLLCRNCHKDVHGKKKRMEKRKKDPKWIKWIKESKEKMSKYLRSK